MTAQRFVAATGLAPGRPRAGAPPRSAGHGRGRSRAPAQRPPSAAADAGPDGRAAISAAVALAVSAAARCSGGSRRREQCLDDAASAWVHAVHDDHRLDAFAARIERSAGRAGPVEGVGGEAPALDLAARRDASRAAPRRRGVGIAGLAPGRRPPSAARCCRAARWRASRCAAMRRCSSRAIGSGTDLLRRLEDQVVREGAVAQDLRRLELAPGLGDVERMRLEHGGGERRR